MTPCVEGRGSKHSAGYLVRRIGGRLDYAHRIAYAQTRGAIPAGMVVHHECKNRRCVNVEHMRLLPQSDHGTLHAQRVLICPRCGGTERIQVRTRPGKSYCAPCARVRDRARWPSRRASRRG